jgi:hypothetical protein
MSRPADSSIWLRGRKSLGTGEVIPSDSIYRISVVRKRFPSYVTDPYYRNCIPDSNMTLSNAR